MGAYGQLVELVGFENVSIHLDMFGSLQTIFYTIETPLYHPVVQVPKMFLVKI